MGLDFVAYWIVGIAVGVIYSTLSMRGFAPQAMVKGGVTFGFLLLITAAILVGMEK